MLSNVLHSKRSSILQQILTAYSSYEIHPGVSAVSAGILLFVNSLGFIMVRANDLLR